MKKTIAHYIAQRIKEFETTAVFGTSGHYNAHQIRAFKSQEVKFCPTNDACETILAATGYAKSARKFGVALISHGSSSTEVLSGLMNSHMEGIPVVVLAATPPLMRQRFKEYHSQKKALMLFKTVAHAVRVPPSKNAGKVIDEALSKCLSYNKPVYIEIPQDVYNLQLELPKKKMNIYPLVSKKDQTQKSTSEIMKIITKSSKTIVWLGEELARNNKSDKLVQTFLEKSKLPFATSLVSKSVVNERMDKFIGVFMGFSSEKRTFDMFKQADTIICLGVGVREMHSLSIHLDLLPCKNYVFVEKRTVKIGCMMFGPVTMVDLLTNLNKSIGDYTIKQDSLRDPDFLDFSLDEYKQLDKDRKLTHDGATRTIVQSGILKEGVLFAESIPLLSVGGIQLDEKTKFYCESIWETNGYPFCASLGSYYHFKKRPILFTTDVGLCKGFHAISSHVKQKTNAVIFVYSTGINTLAQWQQNPQGFKNNGKIDEWNKLPQHNWKKCGEGFGAKVVEVNKIGDLSEALKRISKPDGVYLVVMKLPTKDLPESAKWKLPKK